MKAAEQAEARLSLRGITKRFGSLVAVDGVDFNLAPGEIHALLGENGAGKTTLMRVAGGLLRPDEGEVFVDGSLVSIRSARDASEAGIGLVHQDLRLIDRLSVAENVHVGWEETPRYAAPDALLHRTEELADQFGLAVDPGKQVWELAVGEQQRVAILRTLVRDPDTLLLDEPTAVLTPQETALLFDVIRSVAGEGRSVVFISHKLREVLEIAQRISVMRRGTLVATLDAKSCDESMLAKLMVGKDIPGLRPREKVSKSDAIVALRGISATNDRGHLALNSIDLTVGTGEIVGVAGVSGNGQRELAQVMTGLRRPSEGTVLIEGRDLTGASALRFIRAGVAHIPEDRRSTGLVRSEPIWCSAILKNYRQRPISRGTFLNKRAAKSFSGKVCAAVKLSTDDVDAPVYQLSGGNSQRLLVGRELMLEPRVLVAVHPTQGLDIRATRDVRDSLSATRENGVGVFLISEDLDEILELSDRILVLYDGRIVGEFWSSEATRDEVGLLMGGATLERDVLCTPGSDQDQGEAAASID